MKHKFLPIIRRKQAKAVDVTAIKKVAISITHAISKLANNLTRFTDELSTEISKINQKHG